MYSQNVNMPEEMPSILVSDQLTGIFLKGASTVKGGTGLKYF